MKTQAFKPLHVANRLLSDEERSKIRFVVDWNDDLGLYGQFPELSDQFEAWNQEIGDLMKKADEILSVLSRTSELKSYFEPMGRLHMGWTVNEVIAQASNPPVGTRIWNVNLGDNHNLGLVFLENKQLVIITHQFQHQDDHMKSFHWMLRHDELPAQHFALKIDSYRLHKALTVLSDPEKAQAYIRAQIHSAETFSD